MNRLIRTAPLIALLAGAQPCGAEELGRLFFTPAERAKLDQGSLKKGASGYSSRVLTVDGIVQKHGGGRTVWINGIPQPAGMSDERSPESLPVAVPGQKQPVKVKVGEKVLISPPTGTGE